MEVIANVVKGGNRLLRVISHVVCRDDNGQVRWEGDGVFEIQIPAGTEIPRFRCESVESKEIGGQDGGGHELGGQ